MALVETKNLKLKAKNYNLKFKKSLSPILSFEFWFAFLVLALTLPCHAKITKGPFLLRVSTNRVALMWETDTAGPGKLYYGKDTLLKNHIITKPELIEYEVQTNSQQVVKKTVFIHKSWIGNLQPGRTYSYYVTDTAAVSANASLGPGKVYKFNTPSHNLDEVKFVIYGDSRFNPRIHRQIVEQIIEAKVNFILHCGDLVTDGNQYEQWGTQFFEPLKDLCHFIPIYVIKGNHDLSGQGYFEKLLVPPGQTANFSFDYGPVHFYCADNYAVFDFPECSRQKQILALIEDDITKSACLWKFVSYHQPSLNFGGHWSAWGYPDALKTFSAARVDFVVTGHSHLYERFRPIAPPGTYGSYVTYITSGGGAAPLHSIYPTHYHAHTEKIHHFCLFHIKGNKLVMKAIDTQGRIIDQLEITKTDGRLNKEYLQIAVTMEEIRCFQEANLYRQK